MAGDEQEAHAAADYEARGIACDHDCASRESVAEHAAERERRDLCDGPGCEGEPDGRRAAAEVEDREGDGDRCEVRPDVRDRAPGEEQSEVPLAERLHERMVT